MSWKDRLENIEFTITTGDGKVWKPLWRDSVRDIEYNVEGFEAIAIEGTYVERKKKKGDRFPVIFYFKGDNCIEEANSFEKSARDPRPWIFKHPYFGARKVQPTRLKFDYSGNNIVKITGTLWETISRKYPQEIVVPKRQVIVEAEKYEITIKENTLSEIDTAQSSDQKNALSFTNMLYNILLNIAHVQEEIAEVKQAFKLASYAAQDIIQDLTTYVDAIIDLINFPFIISQDVRIKIDNLVQSLKELAAIFLGNNPSNHDLLFYQFYSASILNDFSKVLVNSDYSDVDEVFYAIDQLSDIYDEILTNLDDFNFSQDPQIAFDTDILINMTIGNLFEIANNSKQKRIIVLPYDDNIVTLAHKYYGAGDDNLQEFIRQNNIRYDEFLQVRRGREIIYFV